MSINAKIGNKIKNFRQKLGLQAKKLAEQIKISPSYLNLIESGKRNIDADLLIKICNELRIELSDLTSEKEINLNNSKIAITKFLKNKNINKSDLKMRSVRFHLERHPIPSKQVHLELVINRAAILQALNPKPALK